MSAPEGGVPSALIQLVAPERLEASARAQRLRQVASRTAQAPGGKRSQVQTFTLE